ncbi:Glu/Leu/Phe/Val dehydrogenase dimerization domain-containing protein [Streptomyces sp. NBC_00233]|uniref:Glu/Leu/Phe/Val dehydrogenase dimerization domain-containing protein n=1 Tax=Streptomyces sp. NBC_00233 TaxID=2975686 RepID=UPI002255FEE8|nr:Glu/Leu/Phe/Val dehydrogenase dimerization domain-containing protein [Streptomyces sp. NBC_00233]MCX5233516.1 hypothetical protein [Streptomyces sp. NBC_00233]
MPDLIWRMPSARDESPDAPCRVLPWQDSKTDATGWIVIDRLVNGVSGGGLFMHPEATVDEVADLARTMSFKNTLQDPQFGGGKGGIRFDPGSPEAEGVLRRFMADNKALLATEWSTGADLYTSNETIEKIAREDLGLPSAFSAMADMISRVHGIPSQAHAMSTRMAIPWNEYFSLDGCATGHSVAEAIRLIGPEHPRVVLQGFGAVGSSTAYFLDALNTGRVTGICERDGYLYRQDGLDVEELVRRRTALGRRTQGLAELLEHGIPVGHRWVPRKPGQSDPDLLAELIETVRPNVLTPCATRYALTATVLGAFVRGGGRYIVSGANNAFASATIFESAQRAGIAVLPEWVSNAGNALLFAETLKIDDWTDSTPSHLFSIIRRRIATFLDLASAADSDLYQGCRRVAHQRLGTAS